jgi:hypothetical protein
MADEKPTRSMDKVFRWSLLIATAIVTGTAFAQSPPGMDTPAANALRDYNQETADVARLNDARLTAHHTALGMDLQRMTRPAPVRPVPPHPPGPKTSTHLAPE